MEKILSINNLYFSYSKKEVLENINIDIDKGTFLSIIGPNGSGKTTLLKNIVNLLSPSKGNVKLYKEDMKNIKYKDLAKKVAVVHQSNNIGFNFSVKDTVIMGRFPYLRRFQNETKEDYEITEKAMKATGIYELKDRSILNISGGELQRVMIARALVQEPEILILDEPISNLDLMYQISILDICKNLNQKENLTVICILHDINLAARYSDTILMLEEGKIHSIDSPKKVITKENIKEVYQIDVDVMKIENTDIPYIIPSISI